ncbi:hypothetical protein RJT34_23870 [Clitoria ternatea]|uniref:Uncharacterized protein n=1 Tax=Clitoria ternatea TaxID=43366 RepID=A0AAN9FLW8_CLITE
MFSSCHHHKTSSHPLQVFSVKPSQQQAPRPSSALSSTKMKNVIHSIIVSHMCRIIRALSKVKAVILEILRGNYQPNINFPSYPSHKKKRSSKISKRIIFGSFRLHYNWCSSKSSHVLPVPSRIFEGLTKSCDDTQLRNDSGYCVHDDDDSQLAGYLQWLEEKVHDDEKNEINEIDMLAEMFIANCHEKFKLEKQESDRRFHEMLARGM